MDHWLGKVVVITGVSSGVGLETARTLVQNGMIVVGLSNRTEKIQNDIGTMNGCGHFSTLACDVSEERNVKRAFKIIKNKFKTVHILINNTNFLRIPSCDGIGIENLQRVRKFNIMGLRHCTRQSLKLMKKNNHPGHIIHISSIPGCKVLDSNVNLTTKHVVSDICETLTNGIDVDEIRVTSIQPGVVKTQVLDDNHIPFFINDRLVLSSENIEQQTTQKQSSTNVGNKTRKTEENDSSSSFMVPVSIPLSKSFTHLSVYR